MIQADSTRSVVFKVLLEALRQKYGKAVFVTGNAARQNDQVPELYSLPRPDAARQDAGQADPGHAPPSHAAALVNIGSLPDPIRRYYADLHKEGAGEQRSRRRCRNT